MRFHKKFGTIVLAVVFSLLAVVIPATPVHAESIELSPSSGDPTDTITVTGTGFNASAVVEIYFDGDYRSWDSVTSGNFSVVLDSDGL